MREREETSQESTPRSAKVRLAVVSSEAWMLGGRWSSPSSSSSCDVVGREGVEGWWLGGTGLGLMRERMEVEVDVDLLPNRS